MRNRRVALVWALQSGWNMHAVDLERLVLAALPAPSRPGASRDVARVLAGTDLTDDAGRAVGQTTQTQAVLAPRPAG